MLQFAADFTTMLTYSLFFWDNDECNSLKVAHADNYTNVQKSIARDRDTTQGHQHQIQEFALPHQHHMQELMTLWKNQIKEVEIFFLIFLRSVRLHFKSDLCLIKGKAGPQSRVNRFCKKELCRQRVYPILT